ncbi:dehydrogenase/reductase SDR family member 4-like isoform X2 [Hyperolius riggenbachi]|uniref:dehydrogenase/reductase SDR family member 4-like isoform X2 n=1 Tax=Hyperolius riggenbachi TaxID=752182 RepID=UPI0035A37A2E
MNSRTDIWRMQSKEASTNNHLTSIASGARNQKPLQNKVAIVTGSSYGIGLAIARRLAQDGAHVLISSRKLENVDKAVQMLKDEGLSVSGVPCHVGKEEDRDRLVTTALKQYGQIDILICNAAVNPFSGPFLDTTEDMWNKVLHVNVTSTFLLVKLVVPHMQKQGSGSIILSSSIVGYIPQQHIGAYSVSKTALLSLTNVLAQALRFMNIRVNGLAFGMINTGFSKVALRTPELYTKLKPLGIFRFGEPEECAGIASFLCSEDASYINGENIAVTGGMHGKL